MSMISGIIQTPLKQIEDQRGKVMHMLRSDAPHFKGFGEVYFSWINPGIVKAWKLHKRSTMNFAVPVGSIRLVLYDNRKKSVTYGMVNEFEIGEIDYCLLTIPDNIWYGFKCLDERPAMVVNCATFPHSPSESITININDVSIPYLWNI